MLSLFYIMFWLTACMDIGVRSSHRKRRTNNGIIYAVIILYYVLAYSLYGYRGALEREAEP
jgi:ABC-type multidrug transport system permease subunit